MKNEKGITLMSLVITIISIIIVVVLAILIVIKLKDGDTPKNETVQSNLIDIEDLEDKNVANLLENFIEWRLDGDERSK